MGFVLPEACKNVQPIKDELKPSLATLSLFVQSVTIAMKQLRMASENVALILQKLRKDRVASMLPCTAADREEEVDEYTSGNPLLVEGIRHRWRVAATAGL